MSQYTREEILQMIEDKGGPEGLDLSGADLSGIDLGYEAIQRALAGRRESSREGPTPIWYSAETGGINLQKATLIGSDLSKANIQWANLKGAYLMTANLQSSIAKHAALQESALSHANIQTAHLGGANLQSADLTGASLQNTILEDADLKEANLPEANLQSAILHRANLRKANLHGSNLQNALLWDADLQGADLQGANLQKARLEGTNLQGANLHGAILRQTILRKANLKYANLSWADLDEARLREANLQGANLRVAKLDKVDLSVVENLSEAWWHHAILDRTRIKWQGLIHIGEEIAREWEEAKEAYLILKDNFNDLGQYDHARECYIKERQMERKVHQQNKRWWPWLWLTLFRWTSTYGQNPVAVLLWTVGWVVLFAAIYLIFLASGMRIAPDQWTEWWPFLYSMASFATLEFSGFEAVSPWAKFATSIESIIGIFWLAYFVYALANRTRSF